MRIKPISTDVPWVYLCLQAQHKDPEAGARLLLPPANDTPHRRWWPWVAAPSNGRIT